MANPVMSFIRWSLDNAEIELVIDYGRDAVERLASCRGHLVEPVLLDWYDQKVVDGAAAEETQARLQLLLEPAEFAATRGSAWGFDTIAELCRTGHYSHRRLLKLTSAPEQILRAAYRVGHADALHDAVSPRYADHGQIAHPSRNNYAFHLALDFLAHLAADPTRGTAARAALLDLADYIEIAGEAAIRLPLHLLDNADRAHLLEIHERRVDHLTSDPLFVPLGMDLLRDNRLIQTALWQAHDARHLQR